MQESSLLNVFGNYQAKQVKKGTWFINFMNGSQNMYLLEGEEKALLIDTGYGAGNLREYIKTLISKPVLVVNTHFHPDHSAGNGEFEQVMVHKDYTIDAPSVEIPNIVPFDLSKLPHPDYKKVIIGGGDTIDLKSRIVDVLEIEQMHCNSALFFYDRKEKLLFVGDEFECAQVMAFDNSHNPDAPYDVEARIKNMKKNAEMILGMQDKIDMILPNHNGFPMDISYVEDYAGLSDAIFNGSAIIEDKLNHPFVEMDPQSRFLCRVRYQKASIFIRKDELMKIYGTHQ